MDFIRPYTLEIVLALVILMVIQFIMLAGQSERLNRLHKLLRSMLTGPEGEDLAAQLERSMRESTSAYEQGLALQQQMQGLQTTLESCTQKCSVVRYDAYGDVSGQQSFSLAMLDGNNNGIIITALYGRHDTRCFGKTINAGGAVQTLSDEETEALAQALSGAFSDVPAMPKEPGKRRFGKRT